MNRRFFVAMLASGAAAQTRLSVAVTASSFRRDDIAAAIEGATASGIDAIELERGSVPLDLREARSLRDRCARAGIAIRSVGYRLSKEQEIGARLAAANALDARHAVTLSPATLAPKLNAEAIRMGVPVALRNGIEGFRTPDEMIDVIRRNGHLGIALDARQMLTDGHDPAVFLRRGWQRVLSVYLNPALEPDVLSSLIGTLYSRRLLSAGTIEITGSAADPVSEVRKLAEFCSRPPLRRTSKDNQK